MLDRLTSTDTGDALWEVLNAVRMTSGVFLKARFTAPWCVSARMDAADLRGFLTDPVQMIAYHYVIEGRLLVAVEGEAPLDVRAGEAVLFARNDPHILGSTLDARPVRASALIQPGNGCGLAQIEHGGGGELTQIICGFLGSSQKRNPLVATLPRMLKIDMARAGSRAWVEASLSFAIKELHEGKDGASMMMSRLSELMFVEAVRAYAETLSSEQTGWLAGIRDPAIGRALALMHTRLNHAWTADALAREVALSRSAFCDRFTALVGMPPMRYLAAWRMQVAQEKLRHGRQPIAQIAYEVGYAAEEAFTRAFKRTFDVPPAAWRRSVQASTAARDSGHIEQLAS